MKQDCDHHTTEQGSHTPTPWAHGSWGGQCHIEHRHDGMTCVYDPLFHAGMTEISGPNKEVVIGSDYDGLVAKTEDIAFIVKAVNNHDALVSALEDARSFMVEMRARHGDSGVGILIRAADAVLAHGEASEVVTDRSAGQEQKVVR